MVYCALTLRIIRSVYINHFETTTNPDYMRGHNQKKDTHTLDFDVTLECDKGSFILFSFVLFNRVLCHLEHENHSALNRQTLHRLQLKRYIHHLLLLL